MVTATRTMIIHNTTKTLPSIIGCCCCIGRLERFIFIVDWFRYEHRLHRCGITCEWHWDYDNLGKLTFATCCSANYCISCSALIIPTKLLYYYDKSRWFLMWLCTLDMTFSFKYISSFKNLSMPDTRSSGPVCDNVCRSPDYRGGALFWHRIFAS